jgi:hypothetical protein
MAVIYQIADKLIMDRFVVKMKSPSTPSTQPDMNWEEEIQYDPGKRKSIN